MAKMTEERRKKKPDRVPVCFKPSAVKGHRQFDAQRGGPTNRDDGS